MLDADKTENLHMLTHRVFFFFWVSVKVTQSKERIYGFTFLYRQNNVGKKQLYPMYSYSKLKCAPQKWKFRYNSLGTHHTIKMIWIMSYDANIYYKREEYVVVPKSAEDIIHAKSYLEPHLLRLKQHDFPFILHKFKRQQTYCRVSAP